MKLFGRDESELRVELAGKLARFNAMKDFVKNAIKVPAEFAEELCDVAERIGQLEHMLKKDDQK